MSPTRGFKLKDSIQLLTSGQSLSVPPGYYNQTDCGILVSMNNVMIRATVGQVILDCSFEDRHFSIEGHNVVIDGLIMIRGSSSKGNYTDYLTYPAKMNGGCMLIFGNNTEVRNSIIKECYSSGRGGAISIERPGVSTRLDRVSIVDSTAVYGGAIWSYGHLTVNSSNFSSNTAEWDGGAIFVQGFNASLHAWHTTFSDNFANGVGGAISIAAQVIRSGCGLQVVGGAVELFDGVVLHRNVAASEGGSIYAQDAVQLLIHGESQQVLISANSGDRAGGIALKSYVMLTISGLVTFSGNEGYGEGDGGAIHVTCGSRVILYGNVRFEGNTASEEYGGYGGAIFMSTDCALDISGVVSFISNLAINGAGGAVYAQLGCSINVSDKVRFINNAAYAGGAVCHLVGGLVHLSGDVSFIRNQGNQGGALLVQNAAIQIMDSVVLVGNQAAPGSSGGAIVQFSGTLSLSGKVSLVNNSAGLSGGALFLSGVGANISGNVLFLRNEAQDLGGAIDSTTSTIAIQENCSFRENSAGGGGAISLRYGSLSSSTFRP